MTDFMNMDGEAGGNQPPGERALTGWKACFFMPGPTAFRRRYMPEQTVEEGIARIKPGDMLVLTPLSPLFRLPGRECLYRLRAGRGQQTETLRLPPTCRGDDYLRVFRRCPDAEAGLLFRLLHAPRRPGHHRLHVQSTRETIGPRAPDSVRGRQAFRKHIL